MQEKQQILNQKQECGIPHIHRRRAPVTCGRCGYTADMGLYHFMDISAHPEWKKVLLDGTFFQWTCPECGECSELIYAYAAAEPDNERAAWLYDLARRSLLTPYADYLPARTDASVNFLRTAREKNLTPARMGTGAVTEDRGE